MNLFLSTSQFARIADQSAEAVRYSVRKGYLQPTARTQSGELLFTVRQAEEWREQRMARAGNSTSEASRNHAA